MAPVNIGELKLSTLEKIEQDWGPVKVDRIPTAIDCSKNLYPEAAEIVKLK
jgi:hypothetical protein